MNETGGAIVIFGDVVRSRRAPGQAGPWLRGLTRELTARHADDQVAPFAFTQGDELQGLLRPSADPVAVVLYASLQDEARPMRWAVAFGRVEAGEGPATERNGEAFLRARAEIEAARRLRDGLRMTTGDPTADPLLDGTAPVLAQLLQRLTTRQRFVARLVLVEHLRQADVAERLHVSRATVSVTYARANIRSIERLAGAVRDIFAAGVRATSEGAANAAPNSPRNSPPNSAPAGNVP